MNILHESILKSNTYFHAIAMKGLGVESVNSKFNVSVWNATPSLLLGRVSR